MTPDPNKLTRAWNRGISDFYGVTGRDSPYPEGTPENGRYHEAHDAAAAHIATLQGLPRDRY